MSRLISILLITFVVQNFLSFVENLSNQNNRNTYENPETQALKIARPIRPKREQQSLFYKNSYNLNDDLLHNQNHAKINQIISRDKRFLKYISFPYVQENNNHSYSYLTKFGGRKSVILADNAHEGTYFNKRSMEWSHCSAECNIGISRSIRSCSQKEISRNVCQTYMMEYKTCNTYPCKKPTIDFRYMQCQSFNKIPYRGQYFNWMPFDNKEQPCSLTCLANGFDFVVVFAPEVLDGTKCRNGSNNVCISGLCRPVGCDKELGSNIQYDECGICGGNNSCQENGYLWKETNFSACSSSCGGGYQMTSSYCVRHLSTIPTIESGENKGQDYQIVPNYYCKPRARPAPKIKTCANFPCPVKWFTGQWTNCPPSCGLIKQRRKVYCGRHSGNNQTVTIVNSLECGDIPKPIHERQCPVMKCAYWKTGEWSRCSVTCGYGVRILDVECIGTDGHRSTECKEQDKPKLIERCYTNKPCEPEEQISQNVGSNLDESRDFNSLLFDGTLPHKEPGNNIGKGFIGKSLTKDLVNDNAIYSNFNGNNKADSDSRMFAKDEAKTSELSKTDGAQIRENENLQILNASLRRPEPTSLLHMFRPDFRYVVSEWSKCTKPCTEGSFRSRSVKCKMYYPYTQIMVEVTEQQCRNVYKPPSIEKCDYKKCRLEDVNPYKKPLLLEEIENRLIFQNEEPAVSYQWKYRGFSNCTQKCLGGVQVSLILCLNERDNKLVPDAHCDASRKPLAFERTCNEHACPPHWELSQWTPCSHSCGSGIRVRSVRCLHQTLKGDENIYVVPPEMCPTPRPVSKENCNVRDCSPHWTLGNWSECIKGCDSGFQRRPVHCQQLLASGIAIHVKDERLCLTAAGALGVKPAHYQKCYAPLDEREKLYCEQLVLKERQSTTPKPKLLEDINNVIADEAYDSFKATKPERHIDGIYENLHSQNNPLNQQYIVDRMNDEKLKSSKNIINNSENEFYNKSLTTTTSNKTGTLITKMMVVLKSAKNFLNVPKGALLKMRCKPLSINTKDGTVPIIWFKDGKNLTARWERHLKSMSSRGIPYYRHRISISPKGILRFKPVKMKDSGRYRCFAYDKPNEKKTAIIQVSQFSKFNSQQGTTQADGKSNKSSKNTWARSNFVGGRPESNVFLNRGSYAKLQNPIETTELFEFGKEKPIMDNSIPKFLNNVDERSRLLLHQLEFKLSTAYDKIVSDTAKHYHPTTPLDRSVMIIEKDKQEQKQSTSAVLGEKDVLDKVENENGIGHDALISDYEIEELADESYSDLTKKLLGTEIESKVGVSRIGGASGTFYDGKNDVETPVTSKILLSVTQKTQFDLAPKASWSTTTLEPIKAISKLLKSDVKIPKLVENLAKTPIKFREQTKAVDSSKISSNLTTTFISGLHKYYWQSYGWTKCTQSCGKNGIQIHVTLCHMVVTSSKMGPESREQGKLLDIGNRIDNHNYTSIFNVGNFEIGNSVETFYKIVDDFYCDNAAIARLPKFRKCGNDDCPTWKEGAWQPCKTSPCENYNVAIQERKIYCAYNNGTYAPRTAYDTPGCLMSQRPYMRRECYNELCKPTWIVSEWGQCSKTCGTGIQTRMLHCVWFNTTNSAGSSCFNLPRPITIKPCTVLKTCFPYQQPIIKNYSYREPSIGELELNAKENCQDQNQYCHLVKQMKLCDKVDHSYRCCESCYKYNSPIMM